MKTIVEIKNGKIVEDNAYLTFCEENNGKAVWLADEKELETKRTSAQNNALHRFCSLLAKILNDMGLDMKKVLKPTYDIPWTTINVKDHLWRSFQIALFNKESTTKLAKQGEVDKIHEVLMRELGEKHHVEYIPFPSKCEKCKHIDCICEE